MFLFCVSTAKCCPPVFVSSSIERVSKNGKLSPEIHQRSLLSRIQIIKIFNFLYIFAIIWLRLPTAKTSANRWRADALLQCRCSDIGAMHRNAPGQCGLVILRVGNTTSPNYCMPIVLKMVVFHPPRHICVCIRGVTVNRFSFTGGRLTGGR